jgi:hypothetical protein
MADRVDLEQLSEEVRKNPNRIGKLSCYMEVGRLSASGFISMLMYINDRYNLNIEYVLVDNTLFTKTYRITMEGTARMMWVVVAWLKGMAR